MHPRPLLAGVVAEPELGRRAAHRFHGCAQASLELVVIVGIEQIVLAIVLVVQHHLHGLQPLLQTMAIRLHLQSATLAIGSAEALIAPAAPVEIGPSQVSAVVPVAAVDQALQSSAVGTRCRAIDPPGMALPCRRRRQGVVGLALIRRRHKGRGPVHPSHQLGESIAEQAGDAQGHIHAWTAKQAQGDQLQIDQPAAGSIPDGPHPQQGKRLGDVFTAVAHGAGAPHRQGELPQRFAFLLQMQIQQQLGTAAAQVPGRLRGQRPQIDAVEIASRRQQIGSTPCWSTGGTGGDAATGQGAQEGLPFRITTTQQIGHQPLRQPCQRGLRAWASWLRCGYSRTIRTQNWGVTIPFRRLQQRSAVPQGLLLQPGDGVAATARALQTERCKPLLIRSADELLFRVCPGIELQTQILRQCLGEPRPLRLGGACQAGQKLSQGASLGQLAEAVQPRAHLRLLEFAEITIGQIEGIGVIGSIRRRCGQQIRQLELRQPDQHLLPQALCPVRPELHRLPVLIDQGLQITQIAMQPGTSQGGREVIKDHRLGAALGLGTFARVVDDERIDVRQRPQRPFRKTATGEAQPLAGQPFQIAVLAHMADQLHAGHLAKPEVLGQVGVGGWQVGRVIAQGRVTVVTTGWLDQHHHVAKAQPMDRKARWLQGRIRVW